MSELKPCPFCGGNAELEYTGDNVQIQCEDCLCSTFDCSDPVATKKVWNNRNPETAINKQTIDEAIEQRIAESKRNAAEEMYLMLEDLSKDQEYHWAKDINDLLTKARGEA